MARDDYGAINVISEEEREILGIGGSKKPDDEEEKLFETIGKAADKIGETQVGKKIGTIITVVLLAILSGGGNMSIIHDYFNGEEHLLKWVKEKQEIMSKTIEAKRGEPLTKWSTKVLENEDGELFIYLPDELTDRLSWIPGDEIEWDESLALGNNFDDDILTLRNLTQEKDDRFSGHEYEI